MDRQLPDRLAQLVGQSAPGEVVRSAARSMEPQLAFGRHFHRLPSHPEEPSRQAAVVALLYPIEDQWHLPLVVRPVEMKHHAGQIALPGGALEPDETSRDAALRELHEELGVAPGEVSVLGGLPSIQVFVTNFQVTPWLAWRAARPEFSPQPEEVACVLEVPLHHLLDSASRSYFRQRHGTISFDAPCFIWQGHRIWGATAIILAELLGLLDDESP